MAFPNLLHIPAVFGRGLTSLGRLALDALLPPRCPGCGTAVGDAAALCSGCWAAMTFLADPWCARCGVPLPFAMPGGAVCAGCLAAPPLFDRARAALAYDDASRPLILAFKHGDRTDAATAFAPWMARAGRELLSGADFLTPVPLHPWRLFMRRFNQAALLACAIGSVAAVPAIPDILVRRRRTRPQGGLDRSARARNIRGAFAVRPAHRDRVRGARIVLVDDVFTTGATVGECAKVLTRAGAVRVDVLTLARVVRDG